MPQIRYNVTTTAEHSGQRYWLHVRQNLPDSVTGFESDGTEILSPFTKPEIANCLYNMTVKNWLLALRAFEDDDFELSDEDNRSAIDKTRQWAMATYDYVNEETPFNENMDFPIYRVFTYWTKPMPNDNVSEVWAYHGGGVKTPFGFDISSGDLPSQALTNMQLMKLNTAGSHTRELGIERPKDEPTYHDVAQLTEAENRETVDSAKMVQLNRNTRPGTTAAETGTIALEKTMQALKRNIQETTAPVSGSQANKFIPPNAHQEGDLITGIFDSSAKTGVEQSDIKTLYFEVARSEWLKHQNSDGESLQFFGNGCKYPYPFRIFDKTKMNWVTNSDLLPSEGGHMDSLIGKVAITRKEDGKIFWNLREVYDQAHTEESEIAYPEPF